VAEGDGMTRPGQKCACAQENHPEKPRERNLVIRSRRRK
jgi:hypothetical protein